MNRYFHIDKIERITSDGEVEELVFNKRVNLLVGKTNAGKTVWLQMLDYVLGKSKPWKELFRDAAISDKYVEIIGYFDINGIKIKIARKPKEHRVGTKVFIDDVPFGTDEFSAEILQKIGYPHDIKFPKGNPYTSQWIELSFRAVFRHIYRREDFWKDIADEQPISEQFAAQTQLLGFADRVFSKEFDDNANIAKDLLKLEAQKEQFDNVMNRIAQEMSPKSEEAMLNSANKDHINICIAALQTELEEINKKRIGILEKGLTEQKGIDLKSQETTLAKQKADLFLQLEALVDNQKNIKKRYNEFKTLTEAVQEELAKLKRTKKAGIISDIKITNCPACDQEIKSTQDSKENCFLCHQPTEKQNQNAHNRVDFEIKQLSSEHNELKEILSSLEKDLDKSSYDIKTTQESINYLEVQIAPLRVAIFAFTNQELSNLDVERGRIQEKVQNYQRLLNNIKYKEELNSKISNLTTQIELLKGQQAKLNKEVDYETIADDLADGMQNYLDYVAQNVEGRWAHKGKVSIAMNEHKIAFYVDNKRWDSLGGLDRKYFLLAYHYGMLTLTGKKNYQYPGLVIVDLEAEFAESKGGSHNHIIEPFIRLCNSRKDTNSLQVIFSGRSFEGLQNTNQIHFDGVWK